MKRATEDPRHASGQTGQESVTTSDREQDPWHHRTYIQDLGKASRLIFLPPALQEAIPRELSEAAAIQELQEELEADEQDELDRLIEIARKADPPPAVIDAFEEVQRAEQNQNKFIREAESYRNKLLGEARGEASKIVEDAKAYKARVVNEAVGEAQRFISVFNEYSKAKEVTRKRLFLETLEEVLSKSNKVIIEQGQRGTGVVPYLALPEIKKRSQATTSQPTGGQ